MRQLLMAIILVGSSSLAFGQSFNDEIEIEFGASVLNLVLRDEGGRASFSTEDKILRSKRVVNMSVQAPEGTYFDDEEKVQLILTFRHKCDLLGEAHLADQQVQLARTNPDVEIVSYSSEVLDSTLNLADDRISGRCHIDMEGQ